jgi:phage-related minor tail protein
VFDGGRALAFAAGGVVSRPTTFALANGGWGVMGEAGPEAIMPLARGADGKLGVSAPSSSLTVNVINNNGSQIKVEESESAQGGKQLQIMVDAAVEQSLGKGRFDRVLSTSYGVTRRGR